MYCIKCGHPLSADRHFCGNCGTRIDHSPNADHFHFHNPHHHDRLHPSFYHQPAEPVSRWWIWIPLGLPLLGMPLVFKYTWDYYQAESIWVDIPVLIIGITLVFMVKLGLDGISFKRGGMKGQVRIERGSDAPQVSAARR